MSESPQTCAIPDDRRAIQQLSELVTVPLGGEHFMRRLLRHVQAEGLEIDQRDRFKLGIVERLAARKPAPRSTDG
ncbi:hypothetical protein [Streptomyces spiramyceticus]|uniref:hypothetical protein n=1 Tax=Streptomyces spiramyceticus TaxID=299717 RepID=UPI00237AAE40|nr:hypothetical protein [Streptomyces spiramyceticus]